MRLEAVARIHTDRRGRANVVGLDPDTDYVVCVEAYDPAERRRALLDIIEHRIYRVRTFMTRGEHDEERRR